jgi:enterochelin esterase-like enzyme
MTKFFSKEKATFNGLDFLTIKSPALGHRADVCAYKPEGDFCDLPIVILLHGVYGSHWAWALNARVHETLADMISNKEIPAMLLVMPSDGLYGDGSAYLKHKNADYEKWIVEDVIALIKESYQETSSKSLIFIAGLSMGGYGALRLGAKYPNIFKAFSGLSSVTNYESLAQFLERKEELDEHVIKPEDVFEILLNNKESLGPFRFDCGENDPLFNENLILHQKLQENQIPHLFEVNPGEHSWEYWKTHIRETLLFFGGML